MIKKLVALTITLGIITTLTTSAWAGGTDTENGTINGDGIVSGTEAATSTLTGSVSATPSSAPVKVNNLPKYDITKLLTLFDDKYRAENFRSMDTILPSTIIKASNSPYSFEKNIKPLKNLTYTYDGKKKQLSVLLEQTQTTGLIVIKNGTIVHEEYYLGNSMTASNTSWSMVKPYLSALIGIAIQDKKINSVNDKVTKYLPELSNSAYKGVTIKQVLQMSSGAKFNEDYADPSSDVSKMIPALFFFNMPASQIVAKVTSESKPGTFKYKSVDAQVLGMLIHKTTGLQPDKYLEKKLWQPLGMESNAYWNTDMRGNDLSFGFLSATLRDFAKFGQLYMNNGKWGNQQIIPKQWIQESVHPDRDSLKPGVASSDFGYQYQWWYPKDNNGTEFVAIGMSGQYTYVNQLEKVVIVKTSADANFYGDNYENITAFRTIVGDLKKSKK